MALLLLRNGSDWPRGPSVAFGRLKRMNAGPSGQAVWMVGSWAMGKFIELAM